MKEKLDVNISVMLPKALVEKIDKLVTGEYDSRSSFIRDAVRWFLQGEDSEGDDED